MISSDPGGAAFCYSPWNSMPHYASFYLHSAAYRPLQLKGNPIRPYIDMREVTHSPIYAEGALELHTHNARRLPLRSLSGWGSRSVEWGGPRPVPLSLAHVQI
jgi:hypothetical protein